MSLPVFVFERCEYMNKRYNKKNADVKSRVIQRQINEIENLKKTIADLDISCNKKDEIINAIDGMQNDFANIIDELKSKKEEYDKLNSELIEMKNAMNEVVFKRKWKLVRWLMR